MAFITSLNFLYLFLMLSYLSPTVGPAISNQQCEHLVNPIGLDNPQPRLTWQMDDPRNGAGQTAYKITVGSDSLQVVKGIGAQWQTGKINSSKNLVTYTGRPLHAFTKYYWSVEAWDKDGKPVGPAVGSFEMGMMKSGNWQGSWISDGENTKTKAAPYFRREFQSTKQIISARAYISAVGLYELYINGQRMGNHRLDPMYTRFDRRTLYVTYDVTKNLQMGKNAIGVLLGNGWYNFQSIGVWDFERAPWRNRPAFCLDIHITYSDRTTEVITSGKSWKTSFSPVIYNSIYTGEHYDARLEQPGWDTPDFNARKWRNVINRQAPAPNIAAQAIQPIRNVEKIEPVSLKKMNDSTYIFNFGRNISGVTQIRLNGDSNTVVRVIHAEKVYPNGYPDQSNVDYFLDTATRSYDPYATDVYKLNGKGPETFMPHFNYKGFQYVEVASNKPIALTKNDLTAWFMHSDVKQVGNIHTSSELFNKIYSATNASYLSNLFGYPTDCPQREKNGWTGDAHIASETGLYNFDGITVYEKWLADHRDEQQPNGVLPSIIPTGGWGYEWGNGPDWTSTIAIIPWNVYLFYGDNKILSDNYANIKRYVDHINELYPTGLTTWGLGDWAPVKSKTPVELTSSIYYYVDVNILAKTAQLLGKPADAGFYSALAVKIKNAINTKYLNRETGQYADGYQTEQAVPLYWGIVPENLKEKAAGILAASVVANSYHLDAGILGAKAILGALSDNGQAETAYRLASQDTFPSWGWWIKNGATTLYENWNIDLKRDLSLNHIMFGEISAWMFKAIGGIKVDETQPGFRHFTVAPHFSVDDMDCWHDSPFGRITSSWKTSGRNIDYTLIVPSGSSAVLKITDGNLKVLSMNGQAINGNAFRLSAGKYQITLLKKY
jgi:alpha-L-rhamnosidase